MKEMKISMVVLMPLLLLVSLLVVATVYASSSQPASGETTQSCSVGPSVAKVAGGNTFIVGTCTRTFTGTVEGEITSVIKATLHCTPFPCSGDWTLRSTGIFVGTVAGSDLGTAVYSSEAKGVFPEFEELGVLVGRTGGLANVRANLVRVGMAGVSATYTGTYHFDP